MLERSTINERKWTQFVLHDGKLKLAIPEQPISAWAFNTVVGFLTFIPAGAISEDQELSLVGFVILWATFWLPCIWLGNRAEKAESKRVLTVADRDGISFWEIKNRLGLKVLGWDKFRHADTDGPALLLNIKPSPDALTARQRSISCIRVGLLDPKLAQNLACKLNEMKAGHSTNEKQQ